MNAFTTHTFPRTHPAPSNTLSHARHMLLPQSLTQNPRPQLKKAYQTQIDKMYADLAAAAAAKPPRD